MDGPSEVGAGELLALSAVVLSLEVFQARLVAYSVQVILVYAIIGIALLGFGAAGTLVALRRDWLRPERLPSALAWSALAFAVLIVLAHAAFVRITPWLGDVDALALCAAGLLSLPFLAAGTLVTLALAAAGARAGRLYAANLIGSGLGCFLPLALLGPLSGERLLGLLALLAAGSALLYVRRAPRTRALRTASVGVLLLCTASLLFAEQLFPIQPEPEPTGQLAAIYRHARAHRISVHKRFDRWNPTGRIEIIQLAHVPGGPEPYPAMFYAQDSTAGSSLIAWDGRTRSQVAPSARDPGSFVARLCSETLYAQGYHRPRPRVLVIGLGGGPDLQCALYNEARAVDVVEINRDSIAAVRGPFDRWLGGIGSHPGVRFHERDGRSFIRAHGGRYDLIQLSGVDTKNNLASAGLALSENQLYTREAFADYFAHLVPTGAVSIIRFGEGEALRLVLTAVQALRALGAPRPERHVAVLRSGIAYGVLARLRPWTAAEARALQQQLHPPHFRGVSIYYYSDNIPFEKPAAIEYLPPLPGGEDLAGFFALLRLGGVAAFQQRYPQDISPIDDDRPFFFDLWRYDRLVTWLWAPHVRALRNLLLSMLVLSTLLILLPLRRLQRSTARAPQPALPLLFACIGLGFIVLEVYLIHRFAMFLGHQAYALSVVLCSLLCSTGIGAAVGGRLLPDPRRRALLSTLAVLFVLLIGSGLLPPALGAAQHAGLPLRALLAVAFIVPLGLALGQPFVAALALAERHDPGRAAWCIGINGFASVIGSVAVVPLALALGYSGVLAAAAALYALAALCAIRL